MAYPRRAVLVDGRVASKTSPDQREIGELSALFDTLREGPVVPRTPRELLEMCFATDAAVAWAAARDDVATGDLGPDDVTAFAEAHNVVDLLCRTRSPDAFMVISVSTAPTCVFTTVTLGLFVDNVMAVAMAAPMDAARRDAVISSATKMLTHIPRDAAVGDVFVNIVRKYDEHGARLLLRIPRLGEFAASRPQLIGALVECASSVSVTRRYAPLAALARIVESSAPGSFVGYREFETIAHSTLSTMIDGRGEIEVRTAAAAAVLVATTTDSRVRVLASMISCLAATMI